MVTYYSKLKATALSILGAECRECGSTANLHITYKHSDGQEERKAGITVLDMYRSVAEGNSDPYLMLCSNCRRAKHRDDGLRKKWIDIETIKPHEGAPRNRRLGSAEVPSRTHSSTP